MPTYKRKRPEAPGLATGERLVEDLYAPDSDGEEYPYPAGMPVLLDAHGVVLLGRARTRGAIAPIRTLSLLVDENTARTLQKMDASAHPKPSVRARAANILRHAGLPLRWIQSIIGCSDKTTASRWCNLVERVPPIVLKALDDKEISFGYARTLMALRPEMIAHVFQQLRREHLTVAELRKRITEESSFDPGLAESIQATERRLSEQLSANVKIHWPSSPTRRRLTITWHGPETLKGIFEKLAQGPTYEGDESHPRELVIAVRDTDELDALTGHLLE